MLRKLKTILIVVSLIFAFSDSFAAKKVIKLGQYDVIVLRDGTEVISKIIQVDDTDVMFVPILGEGTEKLELGQVYMLKFEKRGNVYITLDGKRKTGENQKIAKGADVIYLVSGKEIPGYEVQVNENKITYLPNPRKNKNAIPIAEVLKPEEVFMIVYSDGTKDIINKIPTTKEWLEIVNKPAEEEKVEEEKPKEVIKVVYHKVSRGETLAAVSEMYGVTTDEIIEWNELSNKFKPSSRLPIDRDIIIYQKVIE